MPIKCELAAYGYLNNLPKTKHYGRQCIRTSLDQFELPATNRTPRSFQCLVFKPMADSIWAFRHAFPTKTFPEWLLKEILRHVLGALDYLHRQVKISPYPRVFPDIQEKNILLSVDGTAALEAYEERERTDPVPRKVVGDRVIYLSRSIEPEEVGHPFLSDFGEARFGSTTYMGPIQPQQYRAPEVLLGIPWNKKVDIWSVGVMIWNMFLDKNMFKVTGADNEDDHPRYHIAHMVSLLGPPPADFLMRSVADEPWKYFDARGNWIGAADLPHDSLELSEDRLEGENN